MTIRTKKDLLFKNYFFPGIALFGIIYCRHIFPIKSYEELVEKIVRCLFIILWTILVIKIIDRIISKTICIDNKYITIKSFFGKHVYALDEMENVELENGKRTQAGHIANQLRFKIGRKTYRINSTEYENVDIFAQYLAKYVEIKVI